MMQNLCFKKSERKSLLVKNSSLYFDIGELSSEDAQQNRRNFFNFIRRSSTRVGILISKPIIKTGIFFFNSSKHLFKIVEKGNVVTSYIKSDNYTIIFKYIKYQATLICISIVVLITSFFQSTHSVPVANPYEYGQYQPQIVSYLLDKEQNISTYKQEIVSTLEKSQGIIIRAQDLPNSFNDIIKDKKDVNLDSILKLTGGDTPVESSVIDLQEEKLRDSIILKTEEGKYFELSINKQIKILNNTLWEILDPILRNKDLLRLASEFEKPIAFSPIDLTAPTPKVTSLTINGKTFESSGSNSDFENRLEKQKIANQQEERSNKLLEQRNKKINPLLQLIHLFSGLRRPVALVPGNFGKSGLPAKKTVAGRRQEIKFSDLTLLGPPKWQSEKFTGREKIVLFSQPTLQPTVGSSDKRPTPQQFSADPKTGAIQNIEVAYAKFKERMANIGNRYTGEKQKYFFEQLNSCTIERFQDLACELGKITIYGIREAETELQSEFEGYHEPGSIRRPNEKEVQSGNALDGRFSKGKLSGDKNTLNENYTDLDAKILVSDKTLELQANERKLLKRKNPEKVSMYQQGKNMGKSIIHQKEKHCDPKNPDRPATSENVKHIVNLLELLPSEKPIAKAGVIDGAKVALSDKLNIPESQISDSTALDGIMFLNEDHTIERIN